MRVAFVINSLGAGGTERSTAVLLPYLRSRGVDSTVICLVHRDEGDEARVRDQGFDVRVLRATGTVGRVRELRSLLTQLRPDVVHTAIFEADVVGRLAALGTGVPVVTSLVNTPYDEGRLTDPNIRGWKLRAVQEVDRWTGRVGTTRFHAVTAGVAHAATDALGVPAARITIVERGRDAAVLGERTPERRAEVRERLGLPPEAEVVLAVGRQEHQKGHVELIEALALVAEERPHVVGLLAGRRGNASAATEAALARGGLGDRFRLLGHRDDVADLLVAADVFAMPSHYEGTAGAALEALALGTPVVATRLRGTEGLLVDGDNALLVERGDVRALAAAITATLADPAAAATRAERGRSTFAERFTLDRSADAMVQLYRDVVAEGRHGRRRRRSMVAERSA